MKNLGSQLKFDGTGIEFDSDIPYSSPLATTRKTKLDLSASELPTSLSMGVGYTYRLSDMHRLNISGVYANNSFTLDNILAGAEYSFNDMVFLRGGYTSALYPEDYPSNAKEYPFGLTFGAGVKLALGSSKIVVDYAYRDMQFFEGNQYFSLTFQF